MSMKCSYLCTHICVNCIYLYMSVYILHIYYVAHVPHINKYA